jgi:hypothetical protein
MEPIQAFCVPGKHAGPICGTVEDGGTTPPAWRLVRADCVSGSWVYDPKSPAKVMCCPEHLPTGTPNE